LKFSRELDSVESGVILSYTGRVTSVYAQGLFQLDNEFMIFCFSIGDKFLRLTRLSISGMVVSITNFVSPDEHWEEGSRIHDVLFSLEYSTIHIADIPDQRCLLEFKKEAKILQISGIPNGFERVYASFLGRFESFKK
jgi:hypothetical protein